MCAEHRKDEEAIYYAAVSKPPEERKAYIEAACGDDAELLARVEALLKVHELDDSFLKKPALCSDVTLEEAPLTEGPGTVIGRYKLLEKIGEGGMAYVYMAEQDKPLYRRVALKIIKLGMDTKQVIARFEVERQALAMMDHPNIAKVLDAGATETGRPYFVMELVKGVSITDYCDKNKLSTKERLDLFIQVCNAVQHAHQKGIIHRDIKPSNVMVTLHDGKPVPKVIDFGIAKATSQRLTEKTLFTRYAQLIGTPEYMSPEQAEMSGLDVDTRTDIYSLGVLLYELLTGATPFDAEQLRRAGYSEMQRIIREQEPLKPSTRLGTLGKALTDIAEHRKTEPDLLTKLVRGDLDWIVMKSLEKDRTRRYETVNALAADIHRHLNYEPVAASPPSKIYRLRKFVQKHRSKVAVVATVAAVLIVGLVVSTAMYFRAEQAREKEAAARSEAEGAREKEAVARAQAEQAEKNAENRAEDLRRAMYVNNIQLADAKYKEGNIRRVRELLDSCPNDLRAWEWYYLWHISDQALMTFLIPGLVSLSSDGKRIVSYDHTDKTIRIWDATSGTDLMTLHTHDERSRVSKVGFSPDGKLIVLAGSDSPRGTPDAKGLISVWDTTTGEKVMTLSGHLNIINCVEFSPDGKRIISGGSHDSVKVWDVESGKEVMSFPGHSGVSRLAISRDGNHIVSGSWDGTIKVWDALSGTEITTIRASGWVSSVAFSLDGKMIISYCGDGTIRMWDALTSDELMTLHGHEGSALGCVKVSPDGRHIVSGSSDSTIRLWDATTGMELKVLHGHEGQVYDLWFSPDGDHVISAASDDTTKIWDLTSEDREWVTIKEEDVDALAFSPDGRYFISRGENMVTIWDAETSVELKTLMHQGLHFYVRSAAFSSDGKRMASAGSDVQVRDAVTGNLQMMLTHEDSRVFSVAFSPDNRRIISSSGYGPRIKITVWDAETGAEAMTLRGHTEPVACVEFSSDGKYIVSGSWDDTIKVWNASTGAELKTLQHGATVWSVSFSPDSKRIISGGSNDTVKIWDVETGNEVMSLLVGELGVISVAFSPDGKRIIASGRLNNSVRVWDAMTGAELITLRVRGSIPTGTSSVAFSPDGRTLAVGHGGGFTLFESAVPSCEYKHRQTAQAVRRLVDDLHAKYGYYYEVINKLQADNNLDENVRKMALQIASARKGYDAHKLYGESLNALDSAKRDPNTYKLVLEKAEKANHLEPNNPDILLILGEAQHKLGAYNDALTTLTKADSLNWGQPFILNELGIVQYHVGDYEKALEILTRFDKIITPAAQAAKLAPARGPTTLRLMPKNVAFIAMSLYQLGRSDDAKAALERLRGLLKDERFAENEEAKALLAEAEKLIAGEKQ